MKTQKIKKVLIALDYDPTARKIAETGFALGTSMKADIVLVHVITDLIFYSSLAYSPILGYTSAIAVNEATLDNTDSLINASNQFLDKMKDHLGDKTLKTIVQDGDIAESILNTANLIQADVIVMGSHSKKWLENIIMGSATEKVLHKSTIPLFIVPTKKR